MRAKSFLFLAWLLVAVGTLLATLPLSRVEATNYETISSPTPFYKQNDFSCATVTEIPQIECETLVTFYNSTNGDNWLDNTGWLTTNAPCNWYGVTCNTGNVTELFFQSNHLSGIITSDLENLTNLKHLDLGNNSLNGSIPPELADLGKLEGLALWGNQLSGNIPPELGNLINLKYLNIGQNQLSGSIPPELGNLTNLLALGMADNQLSGNIPPELGNLTNLQYYLMLLNNQLSGNIPPELGNLTKLESLYIGPNQLTGSIPSELGNLTNLTVLWLQNNQLTGSIPSKLGDLVNLHGQFLLSDNQLSGSVPSEFGKLTKLTGLWLQNNQLSGPLPKNLTNITNLDQFYTYNTDLCEPADSDFRTWLGSISDLRSNHIMCEEDCVSPTGLNICLLQKGDILLSRHSVSLPYWFGFEVASTYWYHTAIVIEDTDNNIRLAEASSPDKPEEDQVQTLSIFDSVWWREKNELYDWSVIRLKSDIIGNSDVINEATTYARQKADQINPYILYNTDFFHYENVEDKFYCSQLVWKAYEKYGVDLRSLIAFVVTPDDLYYSRKSEEVQSLDTKNRFIFSMHSPADLLLVDNQGRRVGFDSNTQQTLNEIPGAYYTGTDAEPEYISVGVPNTTTLRLNVTGTGVGTYTLNAQSINSESPISQTIVQPIMLGQIDEFLVVASSGVTTSTEILAEIKSKLYLPLVMGTHYP